MRLRAASQAPGRIKSKTYYNIQVLRGVAALLVVAHHIFILLNERGIDKKHDWVSGAAGVDIFLPISGFVMVLTTYQGWGRPGGNRNFFLKRVLRIAPLYWLLTTLKVILLIVFPALALRGTLELWHTVASYLFWPAANIAEGHNHPILPIGWTLNLEMFFYATFAVALALAKKPLQWVLPFLFILGFAGALQIGFWKPVQFYTNPIIVEFALGMIVGSLIIRGHTLPLGAAWLISILSVCVLIGAEYIPGFSPHWRIYAWGIPGALLLYAMISLEGSLDRLPLFRSATLIGDASYSIYLSHGFILPFVGIVCTRLGYFGIYASIGVVVACLSLSIVCGIFVHRCVEDPLSRFLRRYFLAESEAIVHPSTIVPAPTLP